MAWYPGQAGGTALAEILAGDVNPSGRLPVSFPVAEADLPPFDKSLSVTYDLFHGYRYLDRNNVAPAFSFGFGLSYGDVTYDSLSVTLDGQTVRASIQLTSIDRAGDEIVQLYIAPPASSTVRAVRELRGFERVSLTPGATKTITIDVPLSDFARWDAGWVIDHGMWTVHVGRHSRDLPLSSSVGL
jgi:beta-glucosidase